MDALRQEPIGEDIKGNLYYYFSFNNEDCRLYRQEPLSRKSAKRRRSNEEENDWETVCTSIEEMADFVDSLSAARWATNAVLVIVFIRRPVTTTMSVLLCVMCASLSCLGQVDGQTALFMHCSVLSHALDYACSFMSLSNYPSIPASRLCRPAFEQDKLHSSFAAFQQMCQVYVMLKCKQIHSC